MTPSLALPHAPGRRPTALHGVRLALAWAGWALVLLFAAGAYWAMLPNNYGTTATEWSVEQAYWGAKAWLTYRQWVYLAMALEYLTGAVFAATALLIAWRKPRDWVALATSAALLLFSVIFGINGNLDRLRMPPLLAPVYALVAPLIPVLLIAAFLFFLYLFPNGRFVPRWSGWLYLAAVAAPLVGQLIGVLLSASDPGSMAWTYGSLLFLVALLAGIGAQIYRFRRVATPAERQQTKWVLYGLTLAVGLICLSLAFAVSGVDSAGPNRWALTLQFILQPIALMMLPVTLAVSLLRYGLWDVDAVINRTLLYAALTGAALLIYGLVVGGAALLFGLEPNSLVAMIATGAFVVLFYPLQQRLQRAINRLTYGARDNPVELLEQMGRQLETAAAPEAALAAMTRTVGESLKLPYAALEMTPPQAETAGGVTAAWGAPAGPLERFPLRFQSADLGALVVSARGEGERLSEADRRILATVAQQAGPAVQAMLLQMQLQASRRHIVAAREDERRRLRRDLHDGLGPQLASQTLTIDAIARQMDQNPAQAAALLKDLRRQSQDAVRDIRRIVHALRPPALDDLGLIEALRESAQRAAQGGAAVTLDAPESLPPLPAAVEAAAYLIAQEALANALRHAGARQITLRLCIEADILRIEVTDDGAGVGRDATPGVGLRSMQERAAEVGGQFSLRTSSAGATACALLPLG